MEKVLTTNNGESNWDKLKTFGLHFRPQHIGFNRYAGRNGCVVKVDPATGMRVMLVPASIPRTERAPKADRVPGKRGRPAIVGCVQQFEPQKRGRKPMQGPIMFRATTGKRGRPAFQGPIEQLIFFGPVRKRGPKPMTAEQKAQREADRALNGTETLVTGKKRGRMSIADKIKAAKPGETVKEKGGYWVKLACGLASWVGEAA